jgi:hypothetical protein
LNEAAALRALNVPDGVSGPHFLSTGLILKSSKPLLCFERKNLKAYKLPPHLTVFASFPFSIELGFRRLRRRKKRFHARETIGAPSRFVPIPDVSTFGARAKKSESGPVLPASKMFSVL